MLSRRNCSFARHVHRLAFATVSLLVFFQTHLDPLFASRLERDRQFRLDLLFRLRGFTPSPRSRRAVGAEEYLGVELRDLAVNIVDDARRKTREREGFRADLRRNVVEDELKQIARHGISRCQRERLCSDVSRLASSGQLDNTE